MSYWYQYKQQCFIPGGAKHATPVFAPCHSPGVVRSVPCASCASKDAKLCTAGRVVQSSPQCTPCASSCVEKRVVQGHSSSCSRSSADACTMVCPQPHAQGGQHLCMPRCRQLGVAGCHQMCAPVHVAQHSSYPCSYQWSDTYHYRCGQS